MLLVEGSLFKCFVLQHRLVLLCLVKVCSMHSVKGLYLWLIVDLARCVTFRSTSKPGPDFGYGLQGYGDVNPNRGCVLSFVLYLVVNVSPPIDDCPSGREVGT